MRAPSPGSSARQIAAINGHCGAAHKGRVAAEQVEHQAGDLLGLPMALQGAALGEDLGEGGVVHDGGRELGVHQARGDGVDPNARAAPLMGQGLGQGDQGGLGHRVGALEGCAHHPVDAGHVHDAAALLGCDQALGDLPCHLKAALDVHVKGLVEGRPLQAHHRPKVGVGRRVVDQGVHNNALGVQGLEERADGLWAPGVARLHKGPGAGDLRDAVGRLVQSLLLARDQDDLGSCLRESGGDGLADATTGACDDDRFIFHSEHSKWNIQMIDED